MGIPPSNRRGTNWSFGASFAVSHHMETQKGFSSCSSTLKKQSASAGSNKNRRLGLSSEAARVRRELLFLFELTAGEPA